MDRLLRMSPEAFIASMRAKVEQVLKEVAEAVNNAPDGQLINGSEQKVHDLMEQLRTEVYQQAIQQRINETEGAFSPSAGCDGKAHAEQGPQSPQRPDDQRADRVSPTPLAQPRKPKRRARGPADR